MKLGNSTTKPVWQEAELLHSEYISRTVKSFKFKIAQPMQFLAGQFCDIKLVSEDGVEAIRSYSIASAPAFGNTQGVNELEFGVQILQDGEVSSHMDKMAPGDKVQLLGPLGQYFILDPNNENDLLLIAGGSGIVPLLSMIRYHLESGRKGNIYGLVSVRSISDLPWKDELLSYRFGTKNSGGRRGGRGGGGKLRLTITLSREWENEWRGDTGRIDLDMVWKLLGDAELERLDTFICGRSEFVESSGKVLTELGVKERIKTERFG